MELDDAFSWSFLSDDLLSFYHGKSHHWTEKNSLYFFQTVEEAILHSAPEKMVVGRFWETTVFSFLRERPIFRGHMIFTEGVAVLHKQVIFSGLCSFWGV